MIVAKLISGLGNQLFQYAIGRQIALKNATNLSLDTSFFAGQSLRSYKLDAYNIQAEVVTSNQLHSLLHLYQDHTLKAKLYRRWVRLLPKHKRHYFVESGWWEYEPDLLKVINNTYINGYWQHYRYFEHLDERIFQELTLKNAYPFEAQVLLARIQADASSVSVHIRRGDYLSDTNANNLMGVLPLAYYHSAMTYISSRITSPTYYVFSDDLKWASQNLTITSPVVLVDIAGGRYEQVELDLMSKCRHNIIANSSFSWWGAFLNRTKDSIVIAPAQWVLPPDINARIQLQLPSWVQI